MATGHAIAWTSTRATTSWSEVSELEPVPYELVQFEQLGVRI